MSKYTMELRYILELGYDIGLNDYPIYDETYRSTLNNKIINTFYFSEICEETVARWAIRFKNKMNVIMPYYNQLYISQSIEIDPLSTRKETRIITDKATGETTTESLDTLTGTTESSSTNKLTTDDNDLRSVKSSSTIHNRHIMSDTPQAILSGTTIDQNLYATQANFEDDTRTDTTTDDLTSTKEHNETGNNSSEINNQNKSNATSNYNNNIDRSETVEKTFDMLQSDMLIKYRETFINIDNMIIEELKPLFMSVF